MSTSAFIASNRNISNATFNHWVQTDRVVERYPEILGLGRIVVVQASQLANYAARAIKDPSGPLKPRGSFQVIPSGDRPRYCFIDLAGRSPGLMVTPANLGKEIELEIDAEPGIATQGDPVRLGQVLDNLVSNAIKYTPNGGGVSITMTRTGETATIAVSDTGIGVPAEEQDQLFDRFFRTSNARTAGIEGTGLGLAITRRIVEAHGGTIGFESVEGTGTTFRLTLPHAHACGLESSA